MKHILCFYLVVMLSAVSCKKSDKEEIPNPAHPNMLVIVDNSLYSSVSSKLNTYVADLGTGDTSAKVIKWESAPAKNLKDTVEWYFSKYNIKGAFFIGDLPVATYEMDDWGEHEEFPFDIYFASPGTSWYDGDQDGLFDGHSAYHVSYFIGRITGTAQEINNYLDKVHSYRTQGSFQPKRGYMFIDDDWYSYYYDNKWGLDYLYGTVNVESDVNLTTKSSYVTYLSNSGAEYVNQLVHASPTALYFSHQGEYQMMYLQEVLSLNPKASFYNMFNCSGCRYIEDNLGMSYVMKTDNGLGVIGTTKTGGNYYPQSFNQAIAQGKTWGQAFVTWWNSGGNSLEDKWKLGLVILGDPMLKIQTSLPAKQAHEQPNPPPSLEQVKKLEELILKGRSLAR